MNPFRTNKQLTDIAFVDTETTGLNAARCPIWEIAIIVAGNEHVFQHRLPRPLIFALDAWATPDDAGDYLEPRAAVLNGFLQRYDHDTALPTDEFLKRVCELLDGRQICGAVPSFDEERLRHLIAQWNRTETARIPMCGETITRFTPTWDYHLIDIRSAALGHLAEAGRLPDLATAPRGLTDIAAAVGAPPLPATQRHTALGDARLVQSIWRVIVERSPF